MQIFLLVATILVVGIFCADDLTADMVASSSVRAEDKILSIVSGNGQTGLVGKEAVEPLVVKLADRYGNPYAGKVIKWESSSGKVSSDTTVTDSEGKVGVTYLLGEDTESTDTQYVTATADIESCLTRVVTFEICLIRNIGKKEVTAHWGSGGKSATVGRIHITSFKVFSVDTELNGKQGANAVFEIINLLDSQTIDGDTSYEVVCSNVEGYTEVTLILDTKRGLNSLRVNVSGVIVWFKGAGSTDYTNVIYYVNEKDLGLKKIGLKYDYFKDKQNKISDRMLTFEVKNKNGNPCAGETITLEITGKTEKKVIGKITTDRAGRAYWEDFKDIGEPKKVTVWIVVDGKKRKAIFDIKKERTNKNK